MTTVCTDTFVTPSTLEETINCSLSCGNEELTPKKFIKPKMRANVYRGSGLQVLEEKNTPIIIHDTDAIVRIHKTTICGTDLHVKNAKVPTASPGVTLGTIVFDILSVS